MSRAKLTTGELVALSVLGVALAGGVASVALLPRGLRNNNPGNLERTDDAWVGLAPQQKDPRYFQFVSMPYGMRALGKLLLNYSSRYGLNSVGLIISRYAPPTENDTARYVANVAARLGVGAGDRLDVAAWLPYLMRAITIEENGRDVSPAVYDSALKLLAA